MASNSNFEESINYIKQLLTYGDDALSSRMLYLPESQLTEALSHTAKAIIVVASDFFDEHSYGNAEHFESIEAFDYAGTKCFLGSEKETKENDCVVIYADIIATAYILLSRYEQHIFKEKRDEFGNFPARESILYKNKILEVPVIDYYSAHILKIFSQLDKKEYKIKQGFNTIAFTHDIDHPFDRFTFIHACKQCGRELLDHHRLIVYPFLNFLGIYKVNARATWDYMLARESEVKKRAKIDVKSICFIVSIKEPDQYSMAYIDDDKIHKILSDMEAAGAILGLHTSYNGAESYEQVLVEKNNLEEEIKHPVFMQRNHYLRQIEATDISYYEKAGFKDDYTTGYNEAPGFRLGTTRVVKWINSADGSLHDINIHSLNIMDGSLDQHLKLNYDEAKLLSKNIIDRVYEFGGDLCVLWHNGMFKPYNYQKQLYDWLIEYCTTLIEEQKSND